MPLQRSTIGVSHALLWFSRPRVSTSSAKVSSWLEPPLNLMDQIMSYVFPHTIDQDSQPTTPLISKQVVPYRTHGGTYCPRMSTPKTQSLADLSMTSHITWWIPTVSTIPNLAQTTTSNLTTVNSHLNGWKTNTLNINISQTQYHKDERLVRLSRLHS
jgi:hypothetical protein